MDIEQETKVLRACERAYNSVIEDGNAVAVLTAKLAELRGGMDMTAIRECEAELAKHLPQERRMLKQRQCANAMQKAKQALKAKEAAYYSALLKEQQGGLIEQAKPILHELVALQLLAGVRLNPVGWFDMSMNGLPPGLDTQAAKAIAQEIRDGAI